MFLPELPVDPLTTLVNYLNAQEIGCLWFCGNKTLNWKLSTGGANLDIRAPLFQSNFPDFAADYAQVTEKLKTLRISFPWAFHYLKLALEANPRLFPNLEGLYLDGSSHDHVVAWDLALKWPNLTALSVSDQSGQERPLDLTLLPPQLTYLDCRATVLQRLNDATLPETLTYLDIWLSAQTDIFPLLPPGLTILKVNFDEEATKVHEYDWSTLPRGLLELQIECSRFNYENASQLPPGLTNLRVSNDIEDSEKLYDIMKVLPRTLTAVRGLFPDPLTLAFVQALPPSLRTSLYEDVPEDAVPYLPVNLERVRVAEVDPVRSPRISSFPPNLSSVTVPLIDAELAKVLPTTLRSISVQNGHLTIETLKALPQSITSLITVQERPLESSLCMKYLPINADIIDILPIDSESAERMLAMAIIAPPISASWIGRNVTDLGMGPIVFTQGHCVHNTHLPPENEEDVSVGEITGAPAECACFFANLPPCLNTLKLYTPRVPKGALTALSCKETLESLEIRTHEYPEFGLHHYVTTLPPRLQTFIWTCLGDIAPEQSDLTNQSLEHLPRTIRSFDVPVSPKITEECGPSLPPYIYDLSFAAESPDWFEKLTRSRLDSYAEAHQLPKRNHDD